MSAVRFAIRLPHSWCIGGREAIIRVTEAAEELGFWGVSVQDHILQDSSVSPCAGDHHGGDDRTVFEALQTLAFAGARSERVMLIAGVIVLPYRQPVLVAKELASLDALSEGRVVAGFGVGALRGRAEDKGQNLGAHQSIAVKEFDLFEVKGHRGRLMDEYLDAVATILTDEHATYHGEYVSFDDIQILPRPVQRPRPPIWIGGRSEAAQRRVALRADGWFPSQASAAVLAEGRANILRFAAEAGRPAPTDFGVNIWVSIDERDAVAREAMRVALGHRFQTPEALAAATLSGSPDAVREQVAVYADAGATFLDIKIVPLTLPETLRQMRLFATEVFPAFAG